MTAGIASTRRYSLVVFDFDGTMIDTETAVYEAWAETFRLHGVEPIERSTWSQTIGLSSGDYKPIDLLSDRVGRKLDEEEIRVARADIVSRMVDAMPLRDGVGDWIDACADQGIPLAVASSSPITWVERHLVARDLRRHFGAVSCFGNGVPGKPAPDVYERACSASGIDPAAAIAIEDSPHGVAAAKAAGLTCIATPGPLTGELDFTHADHLGASLADFDPANFLAGTD